jgi:acetyl-CoA carboxylase biotin carboxyl carrier protein
MNLDILKQIVKIAKDDGVAELKIDSKDFKVEVKFATGAIAPIQQSYVAQAPVAAPVSAAPAPVAAAAPKVVDSKHHVVNSPSPGKPLYVKVGDKVKAGQPLCVLEAMKIMNEIDADIAGEIVEICVENESLVEFGQPLFKIKPN